MWKFWRTASKSSYKRKSYCLWTLSNDTSVQMLDHWWWRPIPGIGFGTEKCVWATSAGSISTVWLFSIADQEESRILLLSTLLSLWLVQIPGVIPVNSSELSTGKKQTSQEYSQAFCLSSLGDIWSILTAVSIASSAILNCRPIWLKIVRSSQYAPLKGMTILFTKCDVFCHPLFGLYGQIFIKAGIKVCVTSEDFLQVVTSLEYSQISCFFIPQQCNIWTHFLGFPYIVFAESHFMLDL